MNKFNTAESNLKSPGKSSVKSKSIVEPDLQGIPSGISENIKRRKFLGMGLLSFAGLSVPLASLGERGADIQNFKKNNHTISQNKKASGQSDGFVEKMGLLQDAWSRKDFRLAR